MDIFGKALLDFYEKRESDTLWLHNSYDEPEEMPVDVFFRGKDEMPELELKALSLCKGKVLDIGAGVGSHALLLQEYGFDVTAIDVSAGAVVLMKKRGVKKALVQDIFSYSGCYDTLLLLMNGIGLTGSLTNFSAFLDKAKSLVHPGGQLIFDSSNIDYLYNNLPRPKNKYYGEVSYRYEYQKQKGDWFNWVYIDQETLFRLAAQSGWHCEIIFDDGEDQYLARLKLITM